MLPLLMLRWKRSRVATLTGFWAAVEKGKKVKAIRKGKKAVEDDGRLGESQE